MSYDPSEDTAAMPKLLDRYTQATASMFRPDIDCAIDIATQMQERLARVIRYWNDRKQQCQSSTQLSSAPGSSQ